MADSSCDLHRQDERIETKPLCDGVRAEVQAIVRSGRLRMTDVIAGLQRHDCKELAADVLATLSWQALPPAERNGAFYRSMRLTGIRCCDTDPSRIIIKAHMQHRAVNGQIVEEFPHQQQEFTFSNTEKVRVE